MNPMNKQKLTSAFIALMMTACAFAVSLPSVPRKSPELTISEPAGKTMLLSSFKGKVVVLEFFFLQSPRCMHLAKTLNNLGAEMGKQGFQPVGVVFDPPKVRTSADKLLPIFAGNYKLSFPIGYAQKDDVDNYLGRTGSDLLAIPQVVVIDRKGVIRAATGDRVDPNLEDEGSLRTLIEGLLKEGSSAGPAKNSPAGPAKK
jgi:peroxiredoxin